MSEYHLFKRRYTNRKGKVHTYYWYWYWDPVSGKRIQKPAGRAQTNKHDAQDFIEALPPLPQKGCSVQAIAEPLFEEGSVFLRRRSAFGYSMKSSTRKAYRTRVHKYILPAFGHRDIRTISAQEVEDYLLDQSVHGSTRNAIIDTWNFIFSEAHRGGYITAIPKLHRFRRTSRRYDILRNEELELLFPDDRDELVKRWSEEGDEGERDPLMFAVMLLTTVSAGLRSGEVRALHRDQIFLDLAGIVVSRQLDLDMQLTVPKKGNEENPRYRAIVVPERAVRALRWWMNEYAPP